MRKNEGTIGEGERGERGRSENKGGTFPVLPLSHPQTERKAEVPDQAVHDGKG